MLTQKCGFWLNALIVIGTAPLSPAQTPALKDGIVHYNSGGQTTEAGRGNNMNMSTIAIDPNNFSGAYRVDGGSYIPSMSGVTNFDLAAGSHRVGIGTGEISFDVDGTGIVAGTIVPTQAATRRDSATLIFNTVPVSIDPDKYGLVSPFVPGFYFLSTEVLINYPGPGRQGPANLSLIPGLDYFVDNGEFVGGSAFFFHVDVDVNGNVLVRPAGGAPATANRGKLTFSTVRVKIEPRDYDGQYYLGTFRLTRYFSGSAGPKLNLLGGVPVSVDSGAHAATSGPPPSSSYFYFTPSHDGGRITVTSPAATGHANKLVFNLVRMKVTPSDPAVLYSLSAYPPPKSYAGEKTFTMLPTLFHWIGTGGQIATFTPKLDSVDPSSVVIDGITFSLSIVRSTRPD